MSDQISIQISPPAAAFIRERGNQLFTGNFALRIMDTHCCGGTMHVEVSSLPEILHDQYAICIQKANQSDIPCDIFIDRVALDEGYLPSAILIDLHDGKLELKNARF